MASREKHNDAAKDSDLYVGKTVIVRKVPTAPSIETLVDMLGWLVMHGNLKRTELFKRLSTVMGSSKIISLGWNGRNLSLRTIPVLPSMKGEGRCTNFWLRCSLVEQKL